MLPRLCGILQEKFYLCSVMLKKGALAHPARALDWQSKGDEFESRMLHLFAHHLDDSNDFRSKPFKAASTSSGNLSGVQPKQGMFNLLILFAKGSL